MLIVHLHDETNIQRLFNLEKDSYSDNFPNNDGKKLFDLLYDYFTFNRKHFYR
jgi:hypothetical protein